MTFRPLKILIHIGFLISGISTVIIGQFLPILASKFSLNDAQAGFFFPAQFSGSLVGTFLTNWFGKNRKFIAASAFGCLAMAIGMSLLNFNSFSLCLLGFFINGIGVGLTLPAMNMLILELNPKRTISALNILNFFWGIGAIVSSPFVGYFAYKTDIFIPTSILAVSLLLIGITILCQPRDFEQKRPDENSEESPPLPIWSNPIAWTIAIFNFVHVGFETGIGGWLKLYTERIAGGELQTFLTPIFLYFVFFVAGRGIAPIFSRYLSENRLITINLLIILFGMIILLLAQNVPMLCVGASIAGFGTSSVFPTNVSRFTKIFGSTASRRATPLFVCGTLGAAFTTQTIGILSGKFNNLNFGMLTLMGSILVLIVLQIALNAKTAKVKN